MSRLLLIAEPGLLDVFRMKLSEPAIRNRPEPAFPGVFIRGPLDGVRVIESRLLMLDHATSPPPASIIEDFDRWFREALSRVEWRKMQEEERRLRQLEGVWRI
jgi:hypothetical protein